MATNRPERSRISQKQVAEELRALAAPATTAEGERLNYLTRHIEFLTPYAESWSLAYHLHQVLQQAVELKKAGKAEEAREKVRVEGVPLWLKLAPLVREALLDFQEIVSTRNDLGLTGFDAQQVRATGTLPPARFHEGISGRITPGGRAPM